MVPALTLASPATSVCAASSFHNRILNPVGLLAGFGGCWDVAAGSLIVEEAGGIVLDPAGGPFDVMARRVLAGNRHVAHKAAAILGCSSISKTEPGVPKF